MRVPATRPLLFLPLVTAVVLVLPRTAPAADPIVWRTDYNAARKEAAEKGLPLFVVVGTENCYYCKKLEAGPCRDANVLGQLTTNFIPLKIDATREPNLAKALKVQLYPTIVLAGPDGKIHAFVEGYIEADRLADHLKKASPAPVAATPVAAPVSPVASPVSPAAAPVSPMAAPVSPAVVTVNPAPVTVNPAPVIMDWSTRDLEQATRAISSGDYPKAVSLLKGVTREMGEKPNGVKAQHLLDDIERQATVKISKARELEQIGNMQEAFETLSDAVKTYPGTQAAIDAATLMAGLATKAEIQDKLRQRTARDLLVLAREDYRSGRYYDCLQRCEQLSLFPDMAEAKEGATLAAEVKGNPERLAAACDQMNQRTASLYLILGDSWAAKGQNSEAINAYEKVLKLHPNSRAGDAAAAQIAKLKANSGGIPAAMAKPNP